MSRAPISKSFYVTGYWLVLAVLSGWVLVSFARPIPNVRAGMNGYYRAKFLDMVDGDAYRPFVYRTLLPTTVRLIVRATPGAFRTTLADAVDDSPDARAIFARLGWESTGAYEYSVALVLMFGCYAGFAHFCSKLTMLTCAVAARLQTQLLLAAVALVGLLPFLTYVSYAYDPPQLFLFTMALYFLAAEQSWKFALTFILCCINKETAVLLIAVFGLVHRKDWRSVAYWRWIVSLGAVYLVIKTGITYVYRDNPGSFVEFQLLRNIGTLTGGRSFADAVVLFVVSSVVLYRWSDKPRFLKIAFPSILLPLVVLGIFLGYIDEWRGYYEAYPVGLALAVDSIRRVFLRLSDEAAASVTA